MKRKNYLVQSAIGQTAVRHTANAAASAGRDMVRDYAASLGLSGSWSLESRGREHAPGDKYLVIHTWQVWRHDATGKGLRIVANLQP